ncbi:hypothetical protein [Embleya sp. NPDC005971]|uniref:hypothetical protein n=1 Tax=Embleya sp. NPDC005971 TaxID=3156724 RepID=UPI0033C1AC50
MRLDLYDSLQSTPTATGAERLLAAPVDRTHTCSRCGAHSERVLAEYKQRDGNRRRLCVECARSMRSHAAQCEAADERALQTAWAREVTTDPTSAWAHLHYPPRGRTTSGRLRPPPYVLVTAVDHTGALLVRMTIRLAGLRSTEEVPTAAVPLEKARRQLARRLGGRRLITWESDHAHTIAKWIREGGAECRRVDGDTLYYRLPRWRGIVRDGNRVYECLPPGRADRLYVATVRMAALPELADDARAWLTAGPGRTRVEVTGDEEAARRIHAVLRATGIVADDAEAAPVPLDDSPVVVTMAVFCDRDGVAG